MIAAFSTAIISCGPSAEEKAAADKARQDSINVAMEKVAADSIAMVEKARQDSMMAATEKMKADSIEAAKKAKPAVKPKTPIQKKTEEAKRVTGGRGGN